MGGRVVTLSYTFNDRMAMSEGVSATSEIAEILMVNIPGALNVTKAGLANDLNGTDYWVEHASGRHLSIDCKVREQDWASAHPAEDDLALELWSVKERQVVGWTLNGQKRTDYIFWFWKDTRRWCLVPFPMLCKVFRDRKKEWALSYKTREQHTPNAGNGYHSECVFVPRKIIWRSIYLDFSGDLRP